MENDSIAEPQINQQQSATLLPSMPIQLHVNLAKGTAVLPSWIIVLFSVMFVVSSFSALIVLYVESNVMKEVRLMQLYEIDVENVLIRHSLATRADFAPHTEQQ